MQVTTTTFVLLLCTPLLWANTLYCPSSADLQVAYSGGTISIVNQGWTITGVNGNGGGVVSRASYNLLGGWISYTANFNSDGIGVNGNIYSISPTYHGGTTSSYNPSGDYCDGQGSGSTWCVEVDYIESNGFCGGASTLHTVQGSGVNCGSGGCQASYGYGSGNAIATSSGSAKFTMNISFSSSGVPTIMRNGAAIPSLSPTPLSSDYSALVSAYKNQGATIYSSLWTGWVPESGCGTSGSLSGASFSISNLQLSGSHVQGPSPTLCSGSTPATTQKTSATTSKPATTPTPAPSCNFNTNLAGKQCHGLSQKTGITSQSACQSACCSTSGCKVYQWFSSSSQCWIGSSSVALTTSNCPSSTQSFVSFSTQALTSAETVESPAQKNAPYIIIGVVVLVVLIGALVFTLRFKARKRGQTMSDYVRESVVAKTDKPAEHVPLETTSSASTLPQHEPVVEAQVSAPIAAKPEWEQRVDQTSGQTYFYNNTSGATQWETPDGYAAPSATESS